MNRQTILAIFCRPRPTLPFIEDFCLRYPEFMSNEPIEAEFLHADSSSPGLVLTSNMGNNRIEEASNDNKSSINNTVSFCSNFSRVPVDRMMYRDILKKRKEHPLFTALEKEDDADTRYWYYTDDKDGSIIGPMTSAEMDQRFQLEVFKEGTKMKKKFEEEYYTLSVLVKRYYKNVLSETLDIQKAPTQLSNKVAKFRKGEAPTKKLKEKEVFEQKNREERYFSHAVKPLVNLRNMLPAGEDEDGNEPYSRLRANTLNQNDPDSRLRANTLNFSERPRFK